MDKKKKTDSDSDESIPVLEKESITSDELFAANSQW
jgi:hypothetical protein